jgi:hypothetical protein
MLMVICTGPCESDAAVAADVFAVWAFSSPSVARAGWAISSPALTQAVTAAASGVRRKARRRNACCSAVFMTECPRFSSVYLFLSSFLLSRPVARQCLFVLFLLSSCTQKHSCVLVTPEITPIQSRFGARCPAYRTRVVFTGAGAATGAAMPSRVSLVAPSVVSRFSSI